jgi:hypothetical protein
MKIFLSHRSRDKSTVRDFKQGLPKFLHSWLDEESLAWGDSVPDTLQKTIDSDVDFVLIFLGTDSLESEWVRRELAWALEREQELGRTFVLPIVLGDVPQSSLPETIAKRLYLTLPDFQQGSIGHLAAKATEKLFQLIVTGHELKTREMGDRKSAALDLSEHLNQVGSACWNSPHMHQYHVVTTLREHDSDSGLLIDDTTVTYQIRIGHLGVEQFVHKHRYICEMTMPKGPNRSVNDVLMDYEAVFGAEAYTLSDISSTVVSSGGQDVVRFELCRDIPIRDRTNVRIRQRSVMPVTDRSIAVLARYPTRGFQFMLSYDERMDFEFIWFKTNGPEADNMPGYDEYHVVSDGIVAQTFGWLLPGEGVCVMWEPKQNR